MSGSWNLEDAKALLYLSNKEKEFSEIKERAIEALEAWQQSHSWDALSVLLYWIQTSSYVADPVFTILSDQLDTEDNLMANLDVLEGCATPCISRPELIDGLWKLLGSTENPEMAERVGHIIVLLLPAASDIRFKVWWPAIVSSLTKSEDKRHIAAGLKVWLACLTNSVRLHQNELISVIYDNSSTYFRLLECRISEASKIALQILDLSLSLIEKPISNEFIDYNPDIPGTQDAWKRYISLVEILGIDTSIHQATDSLPDFAALLSPNSPIPALWIITLVNVGLWKSNTEGIRILTMQLVLNLEQNQLDAFTKHPVYTARTLYPRFLQTPNFVVINDRCFHAEILRKFTKNMLKAFIEHGLDSLREFVYEYAQFLLEHAHSFEAPRALIADSMLQTLPPKSLTRRETVPLLAAGKATVVTYTSRALAGLYYSLVKQLVQNSSADSIESSPPPYISGDLEVLGKAKADWSSYGYLSRKTFSEVKAFLSSYPEAPLELQAQIPLQNPTSLFDIVGALQYSELKAVKLLDEAVVARTLADELENPRALKAEERSRLSEAVRAAFNYLETTSFDLCDLAFDTFNEVDTRLAALQCFKRSNPISVPLPNIEALWASIKGTTLRIVDRELHLEFIELLTRPGAVSPAPLDICIEIVRLSVMKRNLLVPLTRGLVRFDSLESKPVPTWVLIVMARVFAFVRSQEYSVRLEELVALEFGIYEQYWGEPESHARAIAAAFLYHQGHVVGNVESIEGAVQDTLDVANLEKRLTGSYDNVDAHLRVIYYEILTFLQPRCSHNLSLFVLKSVQESLESEANPPVRMQAEWLIAAIGVTHLMTSSEFTDFVLDRINALTLESGTPPRVLGSLIRISMLLYFNYVMNGKTDTPVRQHLGNELVLHLLPLATSNKAVVRHRAISALYLLDKYEMAPHDMKGIVRSVAQVNESGVQNSSYQNEAYMFDVTDTRLGAVCGGVSSAVFDRRMPNTLLESDFDALDAYYKDMNIVGPCWSDDNVVIQNRKGEEAIPELMVQREQALQEAVRNSYTNSKFSSHIQTKSGTFDVGYKDRRTSLILVATLCDKPVNLGAITRLGDALGVRTLTMRDLTAVTDAHFKSTALTAEKWVPIEEVKEIDLVDYLLARKAEGYTLVGIEQTDTSMKLSPTLQFPEKTVLMMGHERQGIPPEILGILDACVEIEQLGYVRSMNIQTATAVVVHAYNQNHSPAVHRVGYSRKPLI